MHKTLEDQFNNMLNQLPLQEDLEIILDVPKTLQTPGSLFFTQGTYNSQGATKSYQTQQVQLVVDDYEDLTEYNIFFNKVTGQFTTEETTLSLHYNPETDIAPPCGYRLVGQFLRNGCKFSFIIPWTDCLRFFQEFGPDFDESFNKDEWIDICLPHNQNQTPTTTSTP